jgi:NADH-quinone oxidoreductase subunit H
MYTASTIYFNTLPPDWPGNFWWHLLIFSVLLIAFLLTSVIMFIWYERKLLGRFQIRLGPNRVGPFGLFQAIADMVKILTKEDIIPTLADKLVFWLAPVFAFAPVLMILAVVPLADGIQLVDLNAGLVYILAISSISSIGIFMAGYASNNKYGLIGAMRSIAMLMSYEIPVVLSLASIAMTAGSLSISDIISAQSVPFIIVQPLACFIYFVASLAEINRSPFDILEAESELVSGFNIEYSGMKFAMFYLVEYSEAVIASCLFTTFFLGGWRGPLLPPIVWFIIKMFAVFSFILWLRATLPRFRVDIALVFSWKFLLPLAAINLIITALKTVFLPDLSLWIMIPCYFLITAFLIMLWSRFFKPEEQKSNG